MKLRRAFDKAVIFSCFLCKESVQFPHRGKRIRGWNITVCDNCRDSNPDGIALDQHPRLVTHLNTKGIKVHLNDKGRLDWPPL